MVTVGEGQAYEVPTPKLAAQFQSSQDGFVGKPQLYIGQTLSTGDVQQLVAINYTVEKGDSITSIASRYSLSPGTIIDTNGLKTSEIEKIKPGTQLLIPAEDTDTSLAWLDDLNKMKEADRQKAIAEQQKKDKARAASRPTVHLAASIGGNTILGVYRGLSCNGAVAGQCTCWVKNHRPDLPAQMGNAGQYLVNARRYGFSTGSTPVVGSIMVTNESWVGHVAMVVGVTSDTVTITEMNYVAPYVASKRTISRSSGAIKGYVYWKK
jgi:surface antigen